MSEIVGFNFKDQRMTPNAYGITLEKTFQDGILKGCSMAYSGTVFTIGAGYLVVRGRQLSIPSAMEIAVDQALSGYARIVLTIDLSMTALENSFEQVSVITEYSSTSGGFASLVQEDINISGTKYQVVLAMVSLGTGGITGIVSQMQAVKLFNAPQSVTRAQLANDALYSPIGWNTMITVANIGQTMRTNWNAATTFTITQENSAAIPNGAEIAFLYWGTAAVDVLVVGSGIRVALPGERTFKSNATLKISEQFGLIALKKIETSSASGDCWLVTGNVEVVT